jgi:tetratricopeptide (TPR) repeat protein
MKTLKKLITTVVFLTAISLSAQERMDKINSIVEIAAPNIEGPIWGATEEDSIKGITNYSLYREYYKQDNFKAALPGWRYNFFKTPAARQTTHIDGINMFEEFAKEAEGEAKEAFIDTLLAIYEVRMLTFGKTADLNMRKTFAWFSYRRDGNEEFVFELFNETVELFSTEEGSSINDISPALLYPWAAISVIANKKKLIEDEAVFDVYEVITEVSDYNMTNGNNVGQYKGALDKVADFLDKQGYLNCEKLTELATKQYNEGKDDPKSILKAYKTLRSARCFDAPIFMEVAEKAVKENPSPQLYRFISQKYMGNKSWDKAIENAKNAIELEEDNETKAQDLYNVAQYYQQKGDFSSARTYAEKAADAKSGWGEPYILIGRLYASSGSRCGPGTGWDSQVVVWPAIDMWSKAKNVDPSVAAEAQKLINQYSQYMPSNSDVFMRPDVQVGASYTVGCWINRTTTIRVYE